MTYYNNKSHKNPGFYSLFRSKKTIGGGVGGGGATVQIDTLNLLMKKKLMKKTTVNKKLKKHIAYSTT